MMKKMPIRRNQNIVKLSKDHHFTLLFCWKIRQGLKYKVDALRMLPYVAYFWKEIMQPHFAEEETVLFAALQDEKVKRAIKEHETIRKQVLALLKGSSNDVEKDLSLLSDLVDRHVRFEERELFPHIERSLDPEQLENIGKELMRHHHDLMDDFGDEFWTIPKLTRDSG